MHVWYVLLNSTYLLTYLLTYLWHCRPAFERVFSGQYWKTENLPCGSIQVRLNNKLFCRHTTVGTHMPYGIMPCYLPPDRGDIPAFTPARLVLDLATLEGCKAELTYVAEIVHLPWDNISTLKLSLVFNLLRVVSHIGILESTHFSYPSMLVCGISSDSWQCLWVVLSNLLYSWNLFCEITFFQLFPKHMQVFAVFYWLSPSVGQNAANFIADDLY